MRMLTFLLLSVTVLFFCCCNGKQDTNGVTVNNIEEKNGGLICREPVWNIGTIDTTNGITLQHEFCVENISSEPIVIANVTPTCGCIVTDDYEKTLQSGSSTNLKCGITLPPFPGRIQKFLFVKAIGQNKPIQIQLSIEAVAELNPMLHSFPEKVDFGTIQPGEKKTCEIIVKRYDDTPVEYESITNIAEITELSVVKRSESSKELKLELTLDSANLPLGAYFAVAKVHTRHEKYVDFELSLQANIQDETAFLPIIFIDRISNGELKEFSIWKPGAEKEGITIKSIIYEGEPALDVRRVENDTTDDVRVVVTRNLELTAARTARGTINVVFQEKGGKEKTTTMPLLAFLPVK